MIVEPEGQIDADAANRHGAARSALRRRCTTHQYVRRPARPAGRHDRPVAADDAQAAPAPESQEADRVEQYQQRADLVEHGRGDRTQHSQPGEQDREAIQAEGEDEDVLPDDADRLPGQSERLR